jgi:peroxiredoxin Q/BCP
VALTVGSNAPDFRLPSTGGGEVSLSQLRGKKVVLYFYPKDETPGCTREACDFRDSYAPIRSAGAELLGVSKDSIASHDRFRANHSLPFPLLSDPDSSVATAYGAYGEKVLYGRKFLGTIRSTYLIDEQGKIAAIWSPVKVDGHVDKVAAAVRGESAAAKVKPATKQKPAPRKAVAKKATAAKKARAPAKKKPTSRASSGRASTRRGSARRS